MLRVTAAPFARRRSAWVDWLTRDPPVGAARERTSPRWELRPGGGSLIRWRPAGVETKEFALGCVKGGDRREPSEAMGFQWLDGDPVWVAAGFD